VTDVVIGDREFGANERPNPGGECGLMKPRRPRHAVAIDQRHGRIAEHGGAIDQRFGQRGRAQKTECRGGMKLDVHRVHVR